MRNFLFLDTSAVDDYLAALEGYSIEGAVNITDVKRKDRRGKADVNLLPTSLATELPTETRRRLAMTDAARFQRLYDLLEEQKAVQCLDVFDEGIWGQLRKGEIVEVEAVVVLPEAFQLTQVAQSLSSLMPFMTVAGINPLSSEQERAQFEAVRGLFERAGQRSIPILCEALGTEGYQFVAHLPWQYLRCELSELRGEATVFGKIRRILPKGELLEIFSLFTPFMSSVPSINPQQVAKIREKMLEQGLAPEIEGPAVVLVPVAIYR